MYYGVLTVLKVSARGTFLIWKFWGVILQNLKKLIIRSRSSLPEDSYSVYYSLALFQWKNSRKLFNHVYYVKIWKHSCLSYCSSRANIYYSVLIFITLILFG